MPKNYISRCAIRIVIVQVAREGNNVEKGTTQANRIFAMLFIHEVPVDTFAGDCLRTMHCALCTVYCSSCTVYA